MASGPHPHPHSQYGIVLDAGSSHTSMFIYKWPADKENDTGIVGQHSSCNVRGKAPCAWTPTPLTVGPQAPSLALASEVRRLGSRPLGPAPGRSCRNLRKRLGPWAWERLQAVHSRK